MKKKFAILFLSAFFFFTLPVDARLLPRFRSAKQVGARVSLGALVSARLRGDRLALIVSFNNLQKVTSVMYTLMYQTDGVDQGVSGSLDSSAGNGVSRELLFGTCSSGACRYHGNISNMKLEVVSELPNGKRVTKRFRIRL
jgi:hypothetical protein